MCNKKSAQIYRSTLRYQGKTIPTYKSYSQASRDVIYTASISKMSALQFTHDVATGEAGI